MGMLAGLRGPRLLLSDTVAFPQVIMYPSPGRAFTRRLVPGREALPHDALQTDRPPFLIRLEERPDGEVVVTATRAGPGFMRDRLQQLLDNREDIK